MLELNFSPFPLLETERLILRNFTKDDAHDILEFRGNPVTMQYIPRPVANSLEDVYPVIDMLTSFNANNEKLNWAVVDKETNKVIGIFGYVRFNQESYRAEVGYTLHEDYHGTGIASEALKVVLEYGLKHMGVHAIEAVIRTENIASMKLVEKANFTKNGTFKDYIFFDGQFYDAVIYSLIKGD